MTVTNSSPSVLVVAGTVLAPSHWIATVPPAITRHKT